MMTKTIGCLLFGLLSLTGTLVAEVEWMTDFEAAMERAAQEEKDLLLDFTGTDWCSWCIRLRKEVFDQPEFQAYAAKHLVLVELDFPRKRELEPELAAQNRRLAEAMAVNGYPTVMLCDAQGRAYARTGYRPGGAGPYLEHLEELRKVRRQRDEAFARAATLEGVGKAGALVEALACMDPEMADLAYPDVVEEILRLDPEDVHGLARARRDARAREKEMEERTRLLREFFTGTIRPLVERKAFDELEPALSAFLAAHPDLPEVNRQVLIFNVGLARYRADGDHEAMAAVIDRLAREFPESNYAREGDGMKKRLRDDLTKRRPEGPEE